MVVRLDQSMKGNGDNSSALSLDKYRLILYLPLPSGEAPALQHGADDPSEPELQTMLMNVRVPLFMLLSSFYLNKLLVMHIAVSTTL